jgi:hypothetical protein
LATLRGDARRVHHLDDVGDVLVGLGHLFGDGAFVVGAHEYALVLELAKQRAALRLLHRLDP